MDEDDGVYIRFRAHEAIVAAALCELECGQLNIPFLDQPDAVIHRNITFETFSNQQLMETIGFNRNDAHRVYAALHIPDHFVLNEGRHAFQVPGPISFLCAINLIFT